MSDCFNHDLDAFDDYFYGDHFPDLSSKYTDFDDTVKLQTEKAFLLTHTFTEEEIRLMPVYYENLLKYKSVDYWMPKSKVNIKQKSVSVDSYIRSVNFTQAIDKLNNKHEEIKKSRKQGGCDMDTREFGRQCAILDKRIADYYKTLENDVETGFYDYVRETCEMIIECCNEYDELIKEFKK